MLKTEEYLWVTVFVNTIDITEDTFHFTIIVDGESYVLTGAYNLSPVRINTSKVVNRKSIKITECLPDIKWKSNKNLLAKVETVLWYYKYNEHLTPNKD